jgi:hypothetical protein
MRAERPLGRRADLDRSLAGLGSVTGAAGVVAAALFLPMAMFQVVLALGAPSRQHVPGCAPGALHGRRHASTVAAVVLVEAATAALA